MSLSPEELQQFAGLLQGLLSNDNEARKQAENLFTATRNEHPHKLIVALLTVLQNPGDEGVRHTASVYLWKCLRRKTAYEEDTWAKLSPELSTAVKNQLLVILPAEQTGIIRRKLAEAVGELGSFLCSKDAAQGGDQWPELLPNVFGWNASSGARETALRVLREMIIEPIIAEGLLEHHKASTAGLLQAGLQDPSGETRGQAVLLILSFVENEVGTKQLAALLPQIITVLQGFAQSCPDELLATLQKMVDMVEDHAVWFKASLHSLIQTMLQIAKAKDQIADESRQAAFEFLVSYVEKKTKLCIKIDGLPRELHSLCMQFMLEFEEDGGWEQHVDEEDEETSNYDVGLENVDRLAKAFEAEISCPVVFQLVGEYLQQSWKHKLVALMNLSQLAETVEAENEVDQIVDLLISALADGHPRVRFASMHAIGQTSTDHQPYIQETHGEKLMTALIKSMDDPVARCQSHACAAFVNLGEELPQETMLAFTEPLMQKLGQLAQHPSRYVVEQAITSIAVVAGCIEEHFVPFYQHIIPYMKTMIVQKTAKEERNLRGKCFECVSLVGLGVGKDVFQADAVDLMNAMIATLETDMEADDPQKSFIEEAISRVCRTMKKDFAPFLPKLLDMSLKVLAMKPDFVVNPDDEDEDEDQTITFLQDGTCVGLKTSQINDLQTHLNMVYVFVEVLGPNFFDYVQPTANVLTDLLDFAFDTDIRDVAISTWAEMMKCTKEGLEQRGNTDMSTVSTMLTALITKLGKVIEDEEDCNQLQTLAGGMADAIKAAHPNALGASEVDAVCALSMKLLQESFERRAEANKEVQKVEDDDDEKEEWEMQKQNDEQVRLKVAEIAGALMKTHPDLFMQSGLPRYAKPCRR
jgi:hypothetical protein